MQKSTPASKSSNTASIKKRVYIAAVIESVLFGFTFLGAKVALTELDAIQVLACRWTISMLLFFILALTGAVKIRRSGRSVWPVLAAAFVQPCINTICETCGIDLTTTSESAVIYAMIPIAVALMSMGFFKTRIRPVVAGGIALSFAGVIISITLSDGFSLGGKAAGYLLLLGMVVTGAMFTIMSGRIADRFTPMERTFAMAVMGGIWFNLLNLVRGKGFAWYAVCVQVPKVGLAVLFLGAVGSFACYILFNYVVSNMPAPQASMLQVNLITLTGVVTGILFQGDSFGWYTAVGLLLIIAGVIAANRGASPRE